MSRRKNLVPPEVDLISFISFLSVLICSLLLTAIWTKVGTMDVKQAMGGAPVKKQKESPVLWAYFKDSNHVQFKLKHSKSKINTMTVDLRKEKDLDGVLSQLTKWEPNISSILIKPLPNTVYEQMIVLMDKLKNNGLSQLGIVPL